METKIRRRRSRTMHLICLLLIAFVLGFLLGRLFSPAASAAEIKTTIRADTSDESGHAPSDAATAMGSGTQPDEEDWRLRLVNATHPLEEDYQPELADVGRGYKFDARAADQLITMLEDCKDAGLTPLICSAYRTREKQRSLFEKQVNKQRANGLAGQEAVSAAAEVVASPGTSEHETGLAVDICALDYQLLDEGQEKTPEYQWLKAHCAEYGFILRYPPNKTEITGVIYEPWHFRYVGKDVAKQIMDQGLTLEEYLSKV